MLNTSFTLPEFVSAEAMGTELTRRCPPHARTAKNVNFFIG
jgi:hypothetical protein